MRSLGGQTRDAEIDADLQLAVAELETGRTQLASARELADKRQRDEAVGAAVGRLDLAMRALSASLRRLKPREPDVFDALRPLIAAEGRAHDALLARLTPQNRKRVEASIAAMRRAEARERDDD